jgi:hypothetical protein
MVQTAIPSRGEILETLERILASKGFRNSDQRKDLLKHLVAQSLADKMLSEKEVSESVFPHYPLPPEGRIVSVVATEVRKRLKEYYDGAPSEPVRIALPTMNSKTAYRAEFSYQVSASALENYQLGTRFASEGTLIGYLKASHFFSEATKEQPTFALAHTANAEAAFRAALAYGCEMDYAEEGPLLSLLRDSMKSDDESNLRKILGVADSAAQSAIECGAQSWQAHMVRSGLYACAFNWTRAEEELNAARALNPTAVDIDPLNCAFLIAVDRIIDAKEVLSRRMKQLPGDELGYLLEGLLALLERKPPPPHFHFFSQRWAGVVASLFNAAYTLGADKVRIARHLPLEQSEFYPCGLKQCGKMTLRNTDFFRRRHRVAGNLAEYVHAIADWTLVAPRPSQLAIAYLALAEIKWNSGIPVSWLVSRPLWVRRSPRPQEPPISSTTNELYARSVTALRLACDEHDPMMVWLPRWPFFEPLRKRPDFQLLIEAMNLPRSPALSLTY